MFDAIREWLDDLFGWTERARREDERRALAILGSIETERVAQARQMARQFTSSVSNPAQPEEVMLIEALKTLLGIKKVGLKLLQLSQSDAKDDMFGYLVGSFGSGYGMNPIAPLADCLRGREERIFGSGPMVAMSDHRLVFAYFFGGLVVPICLPDTALSPEFGDGLRMRLIQVLHDGYRKLAVLAIMGILYGEDEIAQAALTVKAWYDIGKPVIGLNRRGAAIVLTD